MANHLKLAMEDVIGIEQGAFIPGPNIADNIPLARELVKHYERKWLTPRACLNIYLHRAFNSVSWGFLPKALVYFGFPSRFVEWIMICIASPHFSVLVNGSPYGYFSGKKGLRQGYPLSPLLFALVMEILSRVLRNMPFTSFCFQPYCCRINHTHFIFADD